MSLLRRKRRQNRIAQQAIPATRNARSFLDFESRGLRTENPKFRHLSPRETKNLGLFTGLVNKPIPRWAINRELELEELRKQSHYKEVMNNRLKPRIQRKPLYTLQLDGSVRVDLPPEHPICRRREERRQILFAIGKTGSGQKPRRDDNNIKVRCEK